MAQGRDTTGPTDLLLKCMAELGPMLRAARTAYGGRKEGSLSRLNKEIWLAPSVPAPD